MFPVDAVGVGGAGLNGDLLRVAARVPGFRAHSLSDDTAHRVCMPDQTGLHQLWSHSLGLALDTHFGTSFPGTMLLMYAVGLLFCIPKILMLEFLIRVHEILKPTCFNLQKIFRFSATTYKLQTYAIIFN